MFAVLAGFYYWVGKITGLQYPVVLSKVHFWTLFFGVNITFFPMHFLGLAGIPRRVPDYPDAYSGWNYVASVGSCISAFSVVIFLVVIYNTLVSGKRVGPNPWDINNFR